MQSDRDDSVWSWAVVGGCGRGQEPGRMLRNAQDVGSLRCRELVDDDGVESGTGICFSARA
jgi:hypothetical protein